MKRLRKKLEETTLFYNRLCATVDLLVADSWSTRLSRLSTRANSMAKLPDFKWLSRITKIEPKDPVSRISTVLRFREKS